LTLIILSARIKHSGYSKAFKTGSIVAVLRCFLLEDREDKGVLTEFLSKNLAIGLSRGFSL